MASCSCAFTAEVRDEIFADSDSENEGNSDDSDGYQQGSSEESSEAEIIDEFDRNLNNDELNEHQLIMMKLKLPKTVLDQVESEDVVGAKGVVVAGDKAFPKKNKVGATFVRSKVEAS